MTRDSRTPPPVALAPTASVRVAPALRRTPEQAVSFVNAFHSRLNLPPARLQEKEAMMREGPAAFFRMMPALFHEDLRGPYSASAKLLERPAPRIPVVGDMHIDNLGTLRGPEGKAIWGLNDFDQAGLGSPEVDLTRLATSAALTARAAGLSGKEQAELVSAFGKAYFQELERLGQGGENPGAFLKKKESEGAVMELISTARETSRKQALEKYVRLDAKGGPRFKENGSLKPVPASVRKDVSDALGTYEARLGETPSVARPLKVLDMAQRLDAGGSSYGLTRYNVLVEAANPKDPPVLLEMKELLAPAIAMPPAPADGAATVEAQQQLDGFTNPLTGSIRLGGRAFLVRELEPEKAKLSPDSLQGKKNLTSLFEQAATVLARAHGATPQQAAQLTRWVGGDAKEATKRLVAFAQDYADQTHADWKAFKAVRYRPLRWGWRSPKRGERPAGFNSWIQQAPSDRGVHV